MPDNQPLARNPDDAVLPDRARIVHWAGPAFLLLSVVLIPWLVYLGFTLPDRQVSSHYNIAWAGFDVFEVVALAATGICAYRRSAFLAVSAAAAGTLMITDAWFDCLTAAPGRPLLESLAMAVFSELPLAGICWWLSYHAEHIEEERVVLLLGNVWSSRRSRRG